MINSWRRLLIFALALGAAGGAADSFRIFVNLNFFTKDTNIVLAYATVFLSAAVYGISVCIVKGVCYRSSKEIRMGILLGLILGILDVFLKLYLSNFLIPNIHIYLLFVGIFAGINFGIVKSSNNHVLYGAIGGVLGWVGCFIVLCITIFFLTILDLVWFQFVGDWMSLIHLYYIRPIYSGALNSATIWFFIALAYNHREKKQSNVVS